MGDVKQHLRKFDFPQSAREALIQVEQLCCYATPQHQRLLQEILDEFIFCEVDKRGVRKKRLTSVQELQLLQVITQRCESQSHEVMRNALFLSIFHHDSSASSKLRLLCKLVSMAIAAQNTAVLGSSAIWMQQLGCTSDIVVSLVRELVTDYCIMVPNTDTLLAGLAPACPQFATHFITATTRLYNRMGAALMKGQTHKEPPVILLQLISSWLTSSPQLCLTPLTTDLKNALPRGSIIMTSVTPLPGLIAWCVEAPLIQAYSRSLKNTKPSFPASLESTKHPPPKVLTNATDTSQTYTELYSKLHLAVLESLLYAGRNKERMFLKNVVNTRDFIELCEHVCIILNHHSRLMDSHSIQLALDRLGQALQVAIATDCIHGNIDDVFMHIPRLPENRLLKIIRSSRK